MPELNDDILESYEEHHVADVLCAELYAMPSSSDHFQAKALEAARAKAPHSPLQPSALKKAVDAINA